jgi:hypothetical protein
MIWQVFEDREISFWHCNRPAYWLDSGEVLCSKCQEQLPEGEA